MKTMPLSIRLDKQLRSLLVEGARRTPFNQRELLRRTLRLHLREVIEQEAAPREARKTNLPAVRGANCRVRPRRGERARATCGHEPARRRGKTGKAPRRS